MEGDGMVAVVRGLREAGLAVTLLDGNRQYTLMPNTTTQPPPAPTTPQRASPLISVMNAATQQGPPKCTAGNTTEPVSQGSAAQCDRDAQAVDGRYASTYKTMHCNLRATSPPVQLTEFPPQRPELYPGHGNFIVGGTGSGATGSPIRASSRTNSFRGGMCWPDRGSVCSPQPSRVVDEFAKSLRKYPNCLSPDRSSEVMERLVNYTQPNKGGSRTFRNASSPTRMAEKSSQNVLESKATITKATRNRTYEPDVTIRPKKIEDPPTRDKKKEEHHDRLEVRCVRDLSKRIREGVKAYMSYPYSHPVCPPTIRENQDYHSLSCDYQNSSNSVNMEIQAAVKMISKEVATLPRGEISRRTVAVPETPISSAGEDVVEGEFYYVENLDIRTSIKSIQTNFYPSDTTLKPRKSAQTVFSTIDFHSTRNRTIVSRKTKSQEEIKVSKDELKMSLLQLINEISDTVSKNTIRDELIKKLFVSDNCERSDIKCDCRKIKNNKCLKFGSDLCSTVCDYVGDFQELVGKLKHHYGDSQHVLRSEIKPFRLSEYRQLDFVLKDWISHLNLKTTDIGRYVDRSELLNSVENRIKELLKDWTKDDFDLKTEIVDILQEIPIEVNKSYGTKSYLRKLVDVLLKRMRNVIVCQQSGKIKRRAFASKTRKIVSEEDMRDYVRAHLLDFLNECNSRMCDDTLDDLENELVDLMMDSVDWIWCGHEDEVIEEMNIIFQDIGKMTVNQANYISNIMLHNLQNILNNCAFNQTYTILNVSNNSGPYMNTTDSTDFSIGSIREEDLDANLDRYTNQLCLQINQWLDTLKIPRIQDSGFREVVVNDLAGDIVDRHKYVELNHTGKDSTQDQLEALKYQIFKWINKLVGDENQETLSHAENLLQRINSIPVPMLVNPKYRIGRPSYEMDSIYPDTDQGSKVLPYSDMIQGLNQSEPCYRDFFYPYTFKDGQETNQSRCCEMIICPNQGQATLIPQGIQAHPRFLPHTDQTGLDSYGQGPQTGIDYRSPQGQTSPNSRGSGRSFGPASPSNPWESNNFSSGFDPSLGSNRTQTYHGNTSGGRMGTSGRNYGPKVDPNHESLHNPKPQAMSDSSTEPSPIRHGSSVPVKKLNEAYDEYLKEWVKKIPIAAKTPAEKQKAETTRLAVYNGIWKSVTKMKLDPNIFGNQYYCQEFLEEEMERLMGGIPKSPEFEAAKPKLKAELLQKTLAMNDLIKSTNAPASFKQQLIDNIENNLPVREPTENEVDKQNYQLDKQNIADYYILYMRHKDEDNVKATVHQKNFLKKLDEFLNKIKSRHNLADMDTNAYANEIIDSFDKIPTPNPPTIKDEADDILLAMEVENWISDIPTKPVTASPLELRRTRDAIVKKIQEIATGVSSCDSAFRIPLKAELPRYLEKLPIQEGINVDYMIDELANRIKNLSTSMRRVSFQDPQSYEEFSKNLPAASSMHEMCDETGSYLIVGGNVVKDPGPRTPAWVRQQPAVPQEDIEWLSMEKTQLPSQMRSGYGKVPKNLDDLPYYDPIALSNPRVPSPQVYNSNASYVDEGNIPRHAGSNRNWGNDKVAVPQKRQKLSIQERRTSPNMRNRSGQSESMPTQLQNTNESHTSRSYPGQGNFVSEGGPMSANWGQMPVPEDEIQWVSIEETQMPSQMRSGSISPQNMRSSHVFYPNESERMASSRSYLRDAQEVQGHYPLNAQTNFGQKNLGPFAPDIQGHVITHTQRQLTPIARGQYPSNLQGGELGTRSPCCPDPLCTDSSHSPGPGYSTLQRFSGSGSPDRYNQSFGPVLPNIPGSQLQRPHAPAQSQNPQASNVQGQSLGPGQLGYNKLAPGVPSGQSYPGAQYPTSPSIGQGPAFNNSGQGVGPYFGQRSFEPRGQIQEGSSGPGEQTPFQEHRSAPIGTVSQDSSYPEPNVSGSPQLTGQPSIYGPIEDNAKGTGAKAYAARQSQGPQASNVQGQSLGSGQLGYNQVAQGVPGGQPYPGPQYPTSPSVGQGPAFNNSGQGFGPHFGQRSFGPRGQIQEGSLGLGGQMPFQEHRSAPIGTVSQESSYSEPNVSEKQPTHNKLGTEREENPPKEPENNKVKPLDVNEKQEINFKSVQTTISIIDITTTECKNSEIKSKSQEKLNKGTKTQEVTKITDVDTRDLHQEVTEWLESHSDKVKVKLWEEKMRKLAEKLRKPGGEEKLKNKIEKYLKQAPDQYQDADDANLEFRKQLPDNIIRKLKQMYLCSADANVSNYSMKIPKYCSRYKIDNFRKAVQNWTKTLNIKKKDFLGRNVKKDDVFKYVTNKLEPLVLDRPQSDSEYKAALQSSISEIVYELPLALSSHNKDFYVNKVTENLVDNICMIERKFSSSYIQPTTEEIKEFVNDEITFFLEKCRVAISTKRMEYLETELCDLLLDLTDIADIDNYFADDVTKLLKEVVKLPEYKAKYFTHLLLKDYKEFFFRENFFQVKGNSDHGRPDVYSAYQNASRLVDFNSSASFETYRQRLVEEINKWITKLNIPINDTNFMELAVKDLASDIVDRYKYLLLNPNLTGTDAEELEHFKFQIFKWTNKLVGEENTSALDHAQELMNQINNIPKPSLQSTSVVPSITPLNIDKINSNNFKSYVDVLTDHIYDWYCELPINLHTSQDARHNKLLIKELAGEIEKGLENKEDGIIDIQVSKWTDKVFNNKLSCHYVLELKNIINNVPFTKVNMANDLKREKVLIRSYEDIVDEWIETVPIAPIKQAIFTNNKNEIVHNIAVKIHKIKTKINQLPPNDLEKKLQEELSHWLKKLPLHEKVDNQNGRDEYAAKLVKSIQRHNTNDSLQNQAKLITNEPLVNQLEKFLFQWLKKLALYRESSPAKKVHQEKTIKGLVHKLNQTIDDKDADKDITEWIRMLDPKQNDFSVKNTAFQLKSHLQKLDVYKDLCKQREQENKILADTLDEWLYGLPLQITDANRFNKQKKDFIKSVKRLLSAGTDNAVMKKEILIFTRSLPISHKQKNDFRYMNEEVFKLIQSLKKAPIGDVPAPCPPISTTSDHHYHNSNNIISNTIQEWTRTLPLTQVHCPRELRSFIDDMSSVVSLLLLNPERWTDQNDTKLHREISKFLRRFPLIFELNTDSNIFRMAGELSKTLKNVTLFRNENSNVLNHVTVYGVSVGNKSTSADYRNQDIKESNINENLEKYTKQLVQQISEWLDHLNLPESHQDGFKEVAINDLAGDIVDRHKYLELNPNNTGSQEDELEHLKYQIFKWINKLVGEDNHETIRHAQELMQRINSIPVPVLVRLEDKGKSQSRRPCQQINSSMGQGNNSQNVNNPIRQARNLSTDQQTHPNHMSGYNNMSYPYSKPCCSQGPPPPPPQPEIGTKDAVYSKYVKIFRDQCNALPLDESTPNNAMLADQARRAIYNGILKTFFNLKSDPIIENDDTFFEFMLEEKLDDVLDVLPQTEEMKKMRHSWKIATMKHAIEMLDELHKLSDKPCFRRTVKDKFNRQFDLDNEIQYCFLLQQGFLSRMADAYILHSNYKEKDPVKANIYRHRLMMEVDKLANHLSKVHNVGFRFFDTCKLSRIAMKTLEHVPIPTDDVLQEEVELIHIADEIDKWYKELPTRPLKDESDGVFRKRMTEILAKKLNDMHKRLDDEDPSKEEKMKYEMSQFLEKRAELQDNEDKNINFMVDQLHFRLKNRWAQLKDPGGYKFFKKAKPLSSTLTHVDNAQFLAPLMVATRNTSPEPAVQRTHGGQEYFIQPGQPMQSMGYVPTSHPGSPQKAIIYSMNHNVPTQIPDGTRMRWGRPNEGYVSQRGAPIQSMQAPISPRVNLEGSQPGSTRPALRITQQTPNRSNMSQQGRQASGVRQSPELIQSQGHVNAKNAPGDNYIGSQRLQNINQSLQQVGSAGQRGPQSQRVKQNIGIGQPGPLFVPSYQVNSQGQSGEIPGTVGSRDPTTSQRVGSRGPTFSQGIGSRGPTPSQRVGSCGPSACQGVGSRGPTPSQIVGSCGPNACQGVGTTTQAATGAGGASVSSEEDILDGKSCAQCGCLESYH